MLQKANITRSLINRIFKCQAIFWPCDENRETRTFCDNWNDRRKMQQGKTALKDDGQTKWLKVGRLTEALKAMRDRQGHDRQRYRA